MKRYTLPGIVLMIILCIFIQGVSAVSVVINPEQINEGDTITISIVDLLDESHFTLQMFSTVEVHEGSPVAFQTNLVTIPFGLKNASVHINVSPVNSAGIAETNQDSYKSITWTAESGVVSKTESLGDASPGTIDVLKVFGTPIDGTKFVDLKLELSGTKTGSDSGDITFGFEGLSEGGVSISVLVDGAEVAHQPILVGDPQSPVADFSASPLSGEAPLSVSFTDESDGVIIKRFWHFGDGTTSMVANPDHVYTSAGTYTVSLTVENWAGDNTKIKDGYITVGTPSLLPEHSVYIGDTAVSINYLIYSPQEAKELVNLLISRQNLNLVDLWYQITDEPVKNILTLTEASEDDLNKLRVGLCIYIDKDGGEYPLDC